MKNCQWITARETLGETGGEHLDTISKKIGNDSEKWIFFDE